MPISSHRETAHATMAARDAAPMTRTETQGLAARREWPGAAAPLHGRRWHTPTQHTKHANTAPRNQCRGPLICDSIPSVRTAQQLLLLLTAPCSIECSVLQSGTLLAIQSYTHALRCPPPQQRANCTRGARMHARQRVDANLQCHAHCHHARSARRSPQGCGSGLEACADAHTGRRAHKNVLAARQAQPYAHGAHVSCRQQRTRPPEATTHEEASLHAGMQCSVLRTPHSPSGPSNPTPHMATAPHTPARDCKNPRTQRCIAHNNNKCI
jgi:hypothetical protein